MVLILKYTCFCGFHVFEKSSKIAWIAIISENSHPTIFLTQNFLDLIIEERNS